MAVEQFTWRVERDVEPEIQYKVITAQFADGYKQTTSDGINNKTEKYTIKVHGDEAVSTEIMNFFNRHKGVRSFIWRPPLGSLGLYTCADPKPVAQGGGLYVITATFERAYASVAGVDYSG